MTDGATGRCPTHAEAVAWLKNHVCVPLAGLPKAAHDAPPPQGKDSDKC